MREYSIEEYRLQDKLKSGKITLSEFLAQSSNTHIDTRFNGMVDEVIEKVLGRITEELTGNDFRKYIENMVSANLPIQEVRNGKDGERGLKGDRGERGLKGEKGKNGKDGRTPIKGLDYFTEQDLKDIHLTGAEIVELINNLDLIPKLQIDAKHIKGLPKKDIREGTALHRGGIDLIWNTQLEGSVNGTNKVFTVPATLKAPRDDKFIVSARGGMKSSDAGDFTTSNGNRTITFTLAPPNGSDPPRIVIYHAK
jgi:hypothetical protein